MWPQHLLVDVTQKCIKCEWSSSCSPPASARSNQYSWCRRRRDRSCPGGAHKEDKSFILTGCWIRTSTSGPSCFLWQVHLWQCWVQNYNIKLFWVICTVNFLKYKTLLCWFYETLWVRIYKSLERGFYILYCFIFLCKKKSINLIRWVYPATTVGLMEMKVGVWILVLLWDCFTFLFIHEHDHF